jgi:hypothetical protein
MSTAPSLFAPTPAAPPVVASMAATEPRTLMDLLYPGFYMVFLLKNGQWPTDAGRFREQVMALLQDVDRGAKRLGWRAGRLPGQVRLLWPARRDPADQWRGHPRCLDAQAAAAGTVR